MDMTVNAYYKYSVRLGEINQEAKEDPKGLIEAAEHSFYGYVENIAYRILNEKKKFIMLAGPSSSGKTTTSHILTDTLAKHGVKSVVISLDDFFMGAHLAPLLENGKPDFETIEIIDLPQLYECYRMILAGEPFLMPSFNFETGMPDPEKKTVVTDENTVFIIEGLHALNPLISKTLPEALLLKLYISVKQGFFDDGDQMLLSAYDVRLIRRIVRDNNYRSCPPHRTLKMWESVRRGEILYINPFKRQADITINSIHVYEPCIFRNILLSLTADILEDPENAQLKKIADNIRAFHPIDPALVPGNSLLREFIQ